MKKRTPEQTEKKRAQEKTILKEMIGLYCRLKHKKGNKDKTDKNADRQAGKNSLCPDCTGLLDYALLRTEKCPFMATKSFCSKCKVHCYKPEMREKIRQVMKFSGPRMMFYFPLQAIKHVFAK